RHRFESFSRTFFFSFRQDVGRGPPRCFHAPVSLYGRPSALHSQVRARPRSRPAGGASAAVEAHVRRPRPASPRPPAGTRGPAQPPPRSLHTPLAGHNPPATPPSRPGTPPSPRPPRPLPTPPTPARHSPLPAPCTHPPATPPPRPLPARHAPLATTPRPLPPPPARHRPLPAPCTHTPARHAPPPRPPPGPHTPPAGTPGTAPVPAPPGPAPPAHAGRTRAAARRRPAAARTAPRGGEGRGGPGRGGAGAGGGGGRGGAGAGLAEPGSPGPRPPDAPTMSRFRAALRATRPETISDNCVVIFSKTSCSYCTMAKKLFHDMNVKYKVVELDMLEYGSQFQDALYKMTGERTVPRIFINGTFIGGATDTHRLHKEGKLLPLVHQCYLKKSKRKEF
uniref:Glutaredoxin-2, mitochondrial n=1 Tax=Canis lupus familiaris TaxID=9615 RepID=A0A8C0PMG6_CANLF